MKKLIFSFLIFFSFALLVLASEQSEEKFNSAMNLYEGVEFQEAIRVTEEAITLDPNVARYYTFLGNIYNQLKEYDKGEKYFEKALSIDSKDAGALNGLGEVYSKREQSDKAIKMYKKAIGITPNLSGMHINLGMEYILVYERQGETKYLKLAKSHLEKAIELNENAYDAYQYLGKTLLELKDYDNTIKVLEKVIKIKPQANGWRYGNLGNVYYDLGAAYYNKKIFKEAIIAFKKSLEIVPDAPDAIFVLGVCYAYIDNKDEAIKQLYKLRKIDNEKTSRLMEVIQKIFNTEEKNYFVE